MSTSETITDDLYNIYSNGESNDSVLITKSQATVGASTVKFIELKISGIEWMNSGCSGDDHHKEFSSLAVGDVLIAGLGLGGDLLLIKDKQDVDSITVVEESADVIDMVWDRVSQNVGIATIVNSDISDYLNGTSLTFDLIWFDHYREIGDDIVESLQSLRTLALTRLNPGGRVLFWKNPVYLPT